MILSAVIIKRLPLVAYPKGQDVTYVVSWNAYLKADQQSVVEPTPKSGLGL